MIAFRVILGDGPSPLPIENLPTLEFYFTAVNQKLTDAPKTLLLHMINFRVILGADLDKNVILGSWILRNIYENHQIKEHFDQSPAKF